MKESIGEFKREFEELGCTSNKIVDSFKRKTKKMEEKIEKISGHSSDKKVFLKGLSKFFSILLSGRFIAFLKRKRIIHLAVEMTLQV